MDNIINEDVFTRVALELFIPPKYKAGMENIDYFGSSYVSLSDSRNFVVQGELLKCFLIMKATESTPTGVREVQVHNSNMKDEVPLHNPTSPNSVSFHIDIRFRDTDDLTKGSTNTKAHVKNVIASSSLHSHVHPGDMDSKVVGLRQDVLVNSPSSSRIKQSSDGRAHSKPNFFRLPNGHLVFPIEVPISIKDKYVGKDVTLAISITRTLSPMKPDSLSNITSAKLLNPQLSDRRSGPSSSRSLQRIVRVLEPLQLQHGEAVAVGRRRLIPVYVENTHPSLPIILHDIQLYLSATPSLSSFDAEAITSILPTDSNNLRDRYTAVTLDNDTFPITVMPGDEYHFAIALEPSLYPRSQAPMPISNLKHARSHSLSHIYSTRRTGSSMNSILDQLVATWSISCSSCMIMSLHPIPTALPPPRDLVISFDGKSPVLVNTVFNACFTITNLADYSRDLTFIIPPPSTPVQVSTSSPAAVLSHFNSSSDLSVDKISLPTLDNNSFDVVAGVEENSSKILDAFTDVQKNTAFIVCLEKTLYIGLVNSNSSVSVNVQYVALKEGLFEIKGLQVIDRATDQIYLVQDNCQIYVTS
jgi:hypothetical protein